MKLQILNSAVFPIPSKNYSLYSLDVKLLEDGKLLPGDWFICVGEEQLFFIVKSIAIGTYNFHEKKFLIEIENSNDDLSKFIGKVFIKKSGRNATIQK